MIFKQLCWEDSITPDELKTALLNGADPNWTSQEGRTPLFSCASSSERMQHPCEIMKILIDAGADVERSAQDGTTALFHCRTGDVVNLLIKNGANINARCNKNCTPLYSDISYKEYGAAKALLDAGATVNTTNAGGVTPLMNYVATSEPIVVKLLIVAKADINAVCNFGMTPLHYAAQWTNIRADNVRLLLEAGASADINTQDKSGKTPLMHVMRIKRSEDPFKIALLLGYGADINIKDKDGNTAIDYAKKRTDLHDSPIFKRLLGSDC